MKKFLYFTTLLVVVLVCFPLFWAGRTVAGPGQNPNGPQAPLLVDTALSSALTVGRVSATQTVSLVRASPTGKHSRYSLAITNMGPNVVYIGPDNTVTASTGYPVYVYQSVFLDRNYSSVYAICDTGLTATVAFAEEGN